MNNSYQATFQRYELKYVLDEKTYQNFRNRIADYFIEDHFGKTTVCNIYFDTSDYRLVLHSLEKPVYKEKLRLRSYGIPNVESQVFVEVKKKYKGIVYKRREDMKLAEAKTYLYEKMAPPKHTQITNEMDWFLRQYETLAPSMYISYDRFALFGKEDKELRITFDHNLLWRKEELDLEKGIFGNPLLKPGQKLMEIKIAEAMPIWLAQILTELSIYPVSYSKYGAAFLESQKSKAKETKVKETKINETKEEKGEKKYA